MSESLKVFFIALVYLLGYLPAVAQDVPTPKPGEREYSPYPEQDFPDQLLFGDTHVHHGRTAPNERTFLSAAGGAGQMALLQ